MAIFTVNGQENHRCALGTVGRDHVDVGVRPLVPLSFFITATHLLLEHEGHL